MIKKELKERIARLEAELAEVKEMAEGLKKVDGGGVFKPEYKQEYWFISRDGQADDDWWEDHFFDDGRYAIGNCFPTLQSTEDTIRVLKLIQKARETQGGFVPDWEDVQQDKYFFYCNKDGIVVAERISNIAPMFGYWKNKSVCEQFVDENREDIIWFFTEYRR